MTLSKNQTLYLLFIVTLGGLALRLYHLTFQSLWLDELYSIVPTAPENSVSFIIESCKADQPPAFFLLIHFAFKIFGYSDVTGKVVVALLGTISIPAIYFLGKEIKDQQTGLFAAVINTVNYFSIYYSQDLRFYSMAFLFTILSYLFFIRCLKNSKLSDFIFYWLTTVILLYTHYYGLLIFGIQACTFVTLIILKKANKRIIIGGIASGIFAFIAMVPWLAIIINDLGITDTWLAAPKPTFLLEYFYGYFGKDIISTVIFLGLTIVFFRFYFKDRTQDFSKSILIILLLWLILSYLIPYVRSIVATPVLLARYTIVTLPAWIILFAAGLTYVTNITYRKVIIAVIVVSSLVNLIFIRKYYHKVTKAQFREVSQYVLQQRKDSEPVYSKFDYYFSFYFRGRETSIARTPSPQNTQSDQTFWLIQADFLPEAELQNEISGFTSHRIAESQEYNGTTAFKMIPK